MGDVSVILHDFGGVKNRFFSAVGRPAVDRLRKPVENSVSAAPGG
jgi:hypothetical protein